MVLIKYFSEVTIPGRIQADTLQALKELKLSDEEYENITFKNAEKIIGIIMSLHKNYKYDIIDLIFKERNG